jgi:hypothetical protein
MRTQKREIGVAAARTGGDVCEALADGNSYILTDAEGLLRRHLALTLRAGR